MDTVRLSNRKPQDTSSVSESIQLVKLIDTGESESPTSKKATIARILDIIIQLHVIK